MVNIIFFLDGKFYWNFFRVWEMLWYFGWLVIVWYISENRVKDNLIMLEFVEKILLFGK